MLYSRSPLVIYFIYNSMYLLIPKSECIPLPLHFPFGNKPFGLFSVSVSLSLNIYTKNNKFLVELDKLILNLYENIKGQEESR